MVPLQIGKERTLEIFYSDLKHNIQQAAQNSDFASSLTHSLYRYPASMSPILARQLIISLTRPGDLVLDPFCGGGTTAIESLAHGRRIICSDINSLARFVTIAKAFPPQEKTIEEFEKWISSAIKHLESIRYLKGKPLLSRTGKKFAPKTHALILLLRDLANTIRNRHVRRLALLTVLKLGKLCFDCNELSPTPTYLISKLKRISIQTSIALKTYSSECLKWPTSHDLKGSLRIFSCNATNLSSASNLKSENISLVLTSPPYPGVHVLYNRWQIHGRSETDLPYALINISDGYGPSYYTFGDRKRLDNMKYFRDLEITFKNLLNILNSSTVVAQVISFANPCSQLSRYRELMRSAGYKELFLGSSNSTILARKIPNRKWYKRATNNDQEAKEYIFLHRPI